jgi:hypothetical protein
VRHVGDEPLLDEREVGELLDLRLDAVRHGVERASEGRQLVLAAHRQAHAELAGGELGAGVGGLADRRRHGAQHEPGDAADQQHQADADDPERALDEPQRLRGVLEVVREVQLVRGHPRNRELLADDDAGNRAAVVGRHREGLPDLPVGARAHRLAQRLADGVLEAQVAREVLRRGGRRRADPERRTHVARGLGREGALREDHHVLQLDAVALRRCAVERALGGRRAAQGVVEHLVLARDEEVVLDGERHPDARHDDGEGGQAERDQQGPEAQ